MWKILLEVGKKHSLLEELPNVHPHKNRRPCDRLTYCDGGFFTAINQSNCNRILYVPVTDPTYSLNHSRCNPYLCNPHSCRYQRQSCVTATNVGNSRVMELLLKTSFPEIYNLTAICLMKSYYVYYTY